MRTIVGGLLVLCGFISVGLANWLHFKAEAELIAKRPELADELYFWGIFRKHSLVEKYYKAEFPDGKRIGQFLAWFIVGAVTFAFGLFLVGFFK